ncbi:hypothetical protein [Campylobacter phage CJLB-12]|nr:hypothetical protein [Campylobacter phage CJLB-12]
MGIIKFISKCGSYKAIRLIRFMSTYKVWSLYRV